MKQKLQGDIQKIFEKAFGTCCPDNPKTLIPAVCELIDNSIDAGATEIRLVFDRSKNVFTISDNGSGFSNRSYRKSMGDIGNAIKVTGATIGQHNFGSKLCFFKTQANKQVTKSVVGGDYLYGILENGEWELLDKKPSLRGKKTIIEHHYYPGTFHTVFSKPNLLILRKNIAIKYAMAAASIFMDDVEVQPDKEFFNPKNKALYESCLCKQPIVVGGTTIGEYISVFLKENYTNCEDWCGRITLLTNQRVIESSRGLSHHSPPLKALDVLGEHKRLRIFYAFDVKHVSRDGLLRVDVNKTQLTCTSPVLKALEALDTETLKNYAELIKREESKEKTAKDEKLLDFLNNLLKGIGNIGTKSSSVTVSTEPNKSRERKKKATPSETHGRSIVLEKLTDKSPYLLNPERRQITINSDGKLWEELQKNKRSNSLLLQRFALWNQLYYARPDVTEFMNEAKFFSSKSSK